MADAAEVRGELEGNVAKLTQELEAEVVEHASVKVRADQSADDNTNLKKVVEVLTSVGEQFKVKLSQAEQTKDALAEILRTEVSDAVSGRACVLACLWFWGWRRAGRVEVDSVF